MATVQLKDFENFDLAAAAAGEGGIIQVTSGTYDILGSETSYANLTVEILEAVTVSAVGSNIKELGLKITLPEGADAANPAQIITYAGAGSPDYGFITFANGGENPGGYVDAFGNLLAGNKYWYNNPSFNSSTAAVAVNGATFAVTLDVNATKRNKKDISTS